MIVRQETIFKGHIMANASIFEPYTMGAHKLANRIVMNPMTRCRADADGVPTEIMAAYYGQRATAGLIVTEGVGPSANGRGYTRQPGLWSAAQVAAWTPVTAAVKAKGGVIFAQLMHTGRVSHPANMPAGARVLAPSALALAGQMYTDAAGMQDYPVPDVMTEADIAQAKAEFVSAARNAIAAGFDGVELHVPTAICWSSSCRPTPTSAPTAMAVRSQTASALWLRWPKRWRLPSVAARSASGFRPMAWRQA